MYPSRLNNLCTNKYSSTILVHTIKISVETKWIAYQLIPWVLALTSLKGFDYIWYATRFLSSYYHAMVLWRQMASYNFVITDSGNDLLPGGIKQLPDPMLINNRRGIVAFSWWQLFKIPLLDMSLILINPTLQPRLPEYNCTENFQHIYPRYEFKNW